MCLAILFAIEQGIRRKETKIAIFTDSLSSLLSIKNERLNPSNKFYETEILKLCANNESIDINTIWIPVHADIHGNEIADNLAKRAENPF